MLLRLVKQAADDVEPVRPAVERDLRLGAALARQRGHAFGVDIGRIRDDEIVAVVAERLEQIAAIQCQAVVEAVVGDVARGDLECIL